MAKAGSRKTGTRKGAAGTRNAIARKPQQAAPAGAARRPTVTRVKLALSKQPVQIERLPTAEGFPHRKRIHARKVIPKLPFGDVVGDPDPNPPLAFNEAGPQALSDAAPGIAPAAAAAITLQRNVQLSHVAFADTASHVCEPSVAINGDQLFVTGNWFASQSSDGGQTFQYINPYTAFPPPSGSSFCCDQVALFSPKFDRFFWLLQYTQDGNGENVQRVAHASSQDFAAGRWSYVDISSASLGLSGSWLDFPDLALTDNKLYVTTNAFVGKVWSGTALVRIAIDRLIAGEVAAEKIVTHELFNFRLAQNCQDSIYWATHATNSQMRVWAWNEGDAAPTSFDLDVPTWTRPPYTSLTPSGDNWLGRVDARLVAGARSGNELFFGWTAGAGGVNARPNPYVQIARIDVTAAKLVDSINLWDPNDAVCCPALGTDRNGDVGVSYAIGGSQRFPSHVVGYVTGNQAHTITFNGQRSPADRKWGDYLAVRRCYPQEDRLIATGYTLQNPTGTNDAVPHVSIFSR
jgi:hypothetical protein